jgi:GalNAc-alpha-(1->4)-GalNAc-alpha-(1->3)-diNAcBac-PP-undecaprenol alpha-1,4-N-acetyl-D-galactosaminyltransferase
MPRTIILAVSSMNTGGAERVAAHLANAWADRGDIVMLLATYSGRGGCAYPLHPNVNFRFLADEVGGAGGGAVNVLRRLIALRRLVRSRNPDVVVSFLTTVNILTIVATLGLDCPVIVAEHSYPPSQPMTAAARRLRRWLYPYAARVSVLTQEGLTWMSGNIPAARSTVIPNPSPFPLIASAPTVNPASIIAGQRHLLLGAGRLDAGKQLSHLIEAFSRLAPRLMTWDLVVLGEGPERQALEDQVASLGLQNRVMLPGRAGNMGDWYERADLFALTSRFEGFPLVIAEALSYGCPVVSYDCNTGPRDIIKEGINGLLVRPVNDIDALVSALARLMTDDELRQSFGAAATATRQRYSLERILALWDALFDEVAARH